MKEEKLNNFSEEITGKIMVEVHRARIDAFMQGFRMGNEIRKEWKSLSPEETVYLLSIIK